MSYLAFPERYETNLLIIFSLYVNIFLHTITLLFIRSEWSNRKVAFMTSLLIWPGGMKYLLFYILKFNIIRNQGRMRLRLERIRNEEK